MGVGDKITADKAKASKPNLFGKGGRLIHKAEAAKRRLLPGSRWMGMPVGRRGDGKKPPGSWVCSSWGKTSPFPRPIAGVWR